MIISISVLGSLVKYLQEYPTLYNDVLVNSFYGRHLL